MTDVMEGHADAGSGGHDEHASDRYKVPRGLDAGGRLRRPSEIVAGEAYRCPVCLALLTVRPSKRGNLFFAHTAGEETCSSETRIHRAAKEQLAALLAHVCTGRLTLSMRIDCARCGKRTTVDAPRGERVATEYLDPANGLRYDVAVLAGDVPAVAFEIAVTSTMDAAKEARMAWPWFEVTATAVLGQRADAALDAAVAGDGAALTLGARRWSQPCECGRCAEERELREQEDEEQRERAAAIEAHRRRVADVVEAAFSEREQLVLEGPAHERCALCGFRRTVDVRRSLYDEVLRNHVDVHGQAWDIALRRDGNVALGVLVVHNDALTCVEHLERARASLVPWIAVAAHTSFDEPAGGGAAWNDALEPPEVLYCNAWQLRSIGACKECARREVRRRERAERAAAAAQDAAAAEERQRRIEAIRAHRRERHARLDAQLRAAETARRERAESERRAAEEERHREAAQRAQAEAEAFARDPVNRVAAAAGEHRQNLMYAGDVGAIGSELRAAVDELRTIAGEDPARTAEGAAAAIAQLRSAARARRVVLWRERASHLATEASRRLAAAQDAAELERAAAELASGSGAELEQLYRRLEPSPASARAIIDALAAPQRQRFALERVRAAWSQAAQVLRLSSGDEFTTSEMVALERLAHAAAGAGGSLPGWLGPEISAWAAAYRKPRFGDRERDLVSRWRALARESHAW